MHIVFCIVSSVSFMDAYGVNVKKCNWMFFPWDFDHAMLKELY